MPLQSIGTFTAGDYIARILQANIGILPQRDGIDLGFLAMLEQIEAFDLDRILQLDPQFAADIIVGLQGNREVSDLADRAMREHGEEAVAAVQGLNEKVLTVMAAEREEAVMTARAAEEKVKGTERVLGTLEEQVKRTLDENEHLKRRLLQVETESFWQRLRRLLGGGRRTS